MYGRRDFGGNREEAGARTVWVESLPGYVDEEFLKHQLVNHGIVRYKVNARLHSGKGDKYAFLEFDSRQTAAQFMEMYQGKSLPGIEGIVKLDFALQNSKNSRGGGGGGGVGFGGYAPTDERDTFSIFVGELSDDVTEDVLISIFGSYFPSTRTAKVVRNIATGASRGFGFVKFSDERDKDKALATMQGFLIGHRNIRVRAATGKNEPPPLEARRHETSGSAETNSNHATLFIGNVSNSVTDEMLKQAFSHYGQVVYARVPPGKGCGFVQMVHRSQAETALSQAHGQTLGGQPIRVAWGKGSQGHSASTPTAYPASNYDSYGYQSYESAQPMDPNAWQHQPYAYHQVYQEQAPPTELPGIGPWHPSLTNQAHQVLQGKSQVTEMSTEVANAEVLLRNQVSILGPLHQVAPV